MITINTAVCLVVAAVTFIVSICVAILHMNAKREYDEYMNIMVKKEVIN